MKNTALITGASSGIGRQLAWVHAETKGDLILIARREEALNELREQLIAQHGINVICIPLDLNQPGAVEQLFQQVTEQGIEVEYLINNAGFGLHGLYHEQDWATDEAMIHLNVTVLCEMTHRFLPGMIQRKRGRILNVGSTAGFQPGPLMAVYYASKAYVLSFSQAIAEEVERYGITVTVLCPGPVDTEFFDRADAKQVSMFKTGATARSVAELGYRTMRKGRLVVINEWRLWFIQNWINPWVPRRTMLKISRWLLET
ncbi:SDR family NAD(P)-dependent oxidoreductase [Bremerella cremea]|uniref:SDR family NAD(P)-dependent oxidoreductase n=1 Tax=Bremerella cremea TaxID=1031537 RepID=A0A368KJ35_9BACT|nr:SDR family oxidoreductase [Bremerella cremea]RCS40573.1 SDR family NAD(P)-dependent oxidoreductase [Bremerella cremea]